MPVRRGPRSTSIPYLTENKIYSCKPIEDNRLLCTTLELAGKVSIAKALVSRLIGRECDSTFVPLAPAVPVSPG